LKEHKREELKKKIENATNKLELMLLKAEVISSTSSDEDDA